MVSAQASATSVTKRLIDGRGALSNSVEQLSSGDNLSAPSTKELPPPQVGPV